MVSNFPFLVVGLVGLILLFRGDHFQLSSAGEFWGWTCFFIGVAAVAFGSSYYHLKPNDATLVWDRLPRTIAFTSIVAIFVIERVDERKGTLSSVHHTFTSGWCNKHLVMEAVGYYSIEAEDWEVATSGEEMSKLESLLLDKNQNLA